MKPAPQHTIEIAQGLGGIRFGCSTEDVQRRLGPPDEREILDPGPNSIEIWYYSSQKLHIGFRESDCGSAELTEKRMGVDQLTTRHPDAELWGTRIIGRKQDEVLELFKQQGYEAFVECDDAHDALLGYKSLRMENFRVTLDFRYGLLKCVLWGRTEQGQLMTAHANG